MTIIETTHQSTERCKCGSPIAKKVNSREFEVMQRQGGQIQKIIFKHNGDKCQLSCSKCGHTTTHGVGKIVLAMAYAIAPRL